MEEELARIALQGGDGNDDFEKSSTYSFMNSSLVNFNPTTKPPKLTEDNMDAYLESLLQKERDKYKDANRAFIEENEGLKGMRELQREEELIRKDENERNLIEMKEMNQVDLKQYVDKYEVIKPTQVTESPSKPQ